MDQHPVKVCKKKKVPLHPQNISRYQVPVLQLVHQVNLLTRGQGEGMVLRA